MELLESKALQDLARANSATGKIIEAHADDDGNVCRVVIEMGDHLRNMQLREAILQLWMNDGFIVSASRDGGYLFIDGIRGQDENSELDMIAAVGHQIKTYTQRSMQRDAGADMSAEVAFLAQALDSSESANLR